jgi:hypothetical protein
MNFMDKVGEQIYLILNSGEIKTLDKNNISILCSVKYSISLIYGNRTKAPLTKSPPIMK